MEDLDEVLADYRRQKRGNSGYTPTPTPPYSDELNSRLSFSPPTKPIFPKPTPELPGTPTNPEISPEPVYPLNIHGFLTVANGRYDLSAFFEEPILPPGNQNKTAWRLHTDSAGANILYNIAPVDADGKLVSLSEWVDGLSGFDPATKEFVSTYAYAEGMWLQSGVLKEGSPPNSNNQEDYNWLDATPIAGGSGSPFPIIIPPPTGLVSVTTSEDPYSYTKVFRWTPVINDNLAYYKVQGQVKTYDDGLLVTTGIVSATVYVNETSAVNMSYYDDDEDGTFLPDFGQVYRIRVACVSTSNDEGAFSDYIDYQTFPATLTP